MSNETRSEQMDKLRGYLVETYRLVADAEKTLAVSADLEERASLRQKISDYERYLQKWRRELEDLQFQQEDSEDLPPENSPERAFGPAYFYEMARKAHSQALYPEALALTQIVRDQDPYYPGLEAFEQRVRQASKGMPDIGWEDNSDAKPTQKGRFPSTPFWIVLGSALLIILVVAIATLLLTTDKSSGGGKNGATTTRNTPPNVVTGVIVFPPATDAPFLVATPTAPVQPSVPPELYGTIVPVPPAPTRTPLPPTPTKKP